MVSWRRLALTAVPLLLLGCGSEDGDSQPPPADEFAAFDEAVTAFLTAEGLAGGTAVVVDKDAGVLHLQGYGSFDKGRLMLIASSSKILSVGVLMRLADDGLLDLDAPISTYLSDWGTFKTDISVAQLLSNSSGMVGLLDDPLYAPYVCQYINTGSLAECAEAIYTADDAADRIPPDTEFRYGGGQWQLAGGIAEVVSGKSWAQLIDEIYLKPCGLTATGFANHFVKATQQGGGINGDYSYPVFFDGDVADLDATDNPNIEGGGYTIAADYAEILLMHLRGGLCGEQRVLSAEAVARMQEDRIGQVYGGTTIDPSLPGYGMGWWVDRTSPVVADAGAYGAMPWLDTGRGYGVMLMLEGEATQGAFLRFAVKPVLDEIMDARAK